MLDTFDPRFAMNTGKHIYNIKAKSFSGIQFFIKLSIMCNISFLSLIRDTKFYASLYSSFPTKYQQRCNCCTATTTYHSRWIVYFVSFYITIQFTWSGVFWCNKSNPVIAQVLLGCHLLIQSLNFHSNS